MLIPLDQLEHHLQQFVQAPLYFLGSSEPFLLQEAADAIRATLRQQGIEDRQIWEIDQGFEKEMFNDLKTSPTLFQNRIIEIRCHQHPFPETLGQMLSTYASQPVAEQILLVSCHQSITHLQKAAWFQKLLQTSVVVTAGLVPLNLFPAWLQTRARKADLKLDSDALSLLVTLTEGNLLAAAQAIAKLSLLYTADHLSSISVDQVQAAIDDQSEFELSTLIEAAFQGQMNQCVRILRRLRIAGHTPARILGIWSYELRILTQLQEGLSQGQPLSQLFQIHRIWTKRQSAFKKALKRYNPHDFFILFKLASQVDRAIKGMEPLEPWEALERLALQLA